VSHTIILRTGYQRRLAARLIAKAPDGYVVTIAQPKRTDEQNKRFWAMLSDVSRAMPSGRRATPEVWKLLFMQAFGHEVQFEMGLDGRPFPVGHQSSRLTKAQMADLITFVQQWGDANGVAWSDERENND
jgi:hypothetical protein